jgi:hypothetical protein
VLYVETRNNAKNFRGRFFYFVLVIIDCNIDKQSVLFVIPFPRFIIFVTASGNATKWVLDPTNTFTKKICSAQCTQTLFYYLNVSSKTEAE